MAHAGRGLSLRWAIVRPPLVFALNVVAALLLLFEEWGWRPLSNLVAQLARFPLWAKLELWIAGLPPYAALTTLAVPSAILIPAKLLGVYLLATGHLVSATTVIVLAKLASTALITRIFILTKPSLMRIGWFARAYELFVPWQEALFAYIRNSSVWRYGRMLKARVANSLRRSWAALRPLIVTRWAQIAPTMARMRGRLRKMMADTFGRLMPARRGEVRRLPPPDARP
jgi:hypothetical protein